MTKELIIPVFRTFLKSDDADNIFNLVTATGFFNHEENLIAKELVDETIKKGKNAGYEFIIAEYDNKIIGYSCYGQIPATDNRYDLYWIAVNPDFQNNNIGSLILKETENKIREFNGKHIYIETSSKPQYQKTRRFYLKNQYNEIAILKDFYCENDSKIIYQKIL